MQMLEKSMHEQGGAPSVVVAARDLWNLAEYVALHRTQAVFSYREGKFRVRFPHLTPQRFGQVLADWEAWRRGEHVGA